MNLTAICQGEDAIQVILNNYNKYSKAYIYDLLSLLLYHSEHLSWFLK